jgi:hypothetical protein
VQIAIFRKGHAGCHLSGPQLTSIVRKRIIMKTNPKVVSLQVIFNEEAENTYVMVETDDIEKANLIARQWAEKKIGKKSSEVIKNKGIIDVPEIDADDEFMGYRIWELPF